MSEQLNKDSLNKTTNTNIQLSSTQINEAKSWYNKQNYTTSFIKKVQTTVGTTDDGIVGKNTVNAVCNWQSKNNLTHDGKFGKASANLAGLTIETNKTTKDNKTNKDTSTKKDDIVIPSGTGINATPLFQKQYDYPNSPYVSKSDYNKMKDAMGGADYSTWDITDSKISGIYASAKKSNGGNSTIKSSGCGVTSLANLKGISPTAAAEQSMTGGYRVYGSGTSGSFLENNGGTATYDIKAALKSIAEGKRMICSVKNCIWHTKNSGGHFILIYGYDGQNVYVSDPASASNDRAIASSSEITKSGAFKYGYLF